MVEPLIINNFDLGMADSAHLGFGLMRNVDIDAFPGAVKVNPSTSTLFHTAYTSTFTAVAATDVCTSDATVPNTGTAVKPTTTTTLPAGLTANTVYFVGKISSTTFYFYDTITNAEAGGATGRVNITDTGTGTHTVTTVNPGTVNHIIKDQRSGNYFLQDSNGRVWFGTASPVQLLFNATLDNAVVGSASLTNANGNGIVLYKQNDSASTYWLMAFRNALIDIIDVYTDADKKTPSWTNGWDFGGTASDSTLNSGAGSGNRHHAIVGQDDIVYFTDGRYIGSIKEASGQTFAAGTTSTYTGNDQALDLPTDEIAVHLEELGTNLLIAGSKSNNIYPWDRISDSFNLPLKVPEYNVQRMKNIGNLVYVLAGTAGNIYTTQGTYVKFFKKLPDQAGNNSGTLQSNVITWGGIASIKTGLLFGAGVLTSGNSGVYLLYPDGRLVIDNIPSTGSGNATALYAENNFYFLGYASGADQVSTSRYASFEGVVQSQLYKVATKTGKGTFSVLECVIAKPASTGNVRVGYRVDTSSSFTTLATYAADSSATTFFTQGIGLIDIENIQVQAEIDGNMELMEIRLLP